MKTKKELFGIELTTYRQAMTGVRSLEGRSGRSGDSSLRLFQFPKLQINACHLVAAINGLLHFRLQERLRLLAETCDIIEERFRQWFGG
ncbi:MAG: hypothetical protein Q8P30_03670 [Candidatus Uhrbacteria bacterium]|nr:hypothetical protein [Candidatus Uhrbacteria bacterium]